MKNNLCSLILPSAESTCNDNHVNVDILTRIKKAKNNKYMKDTWKTMTVTFVDSGETYTYEQLDKWFNQQLGKFS